MATFADDAGPVLGIDLGTTFSCVAVYDDAEKKVKVLENSEGARTTPSYVAFTETGRLVGAAAKSQAASNAKGTLFDVKRIIGRTFQDHVVQDECKRLPFPIREHPSKSKRPLVEVRWRGKTKQFAPEEVSAMVLQEMADIAAKKLGREITRAVITVPAHFNDQQRQATKDAGRIAGLEVLRIINEPTAAALAYGLHDLATKSSEVGRVLIFDLGGGTFDVSVLQLEGGVFAVQATGGDTHLGGEDFDARLVDHVIRAHARKACGPKIKNVKNGHKNQKGSSAAEKKRKQEEQQIIGKLKADPKAMRRLARLCENAKRELSTADDAEVEAEELQPGLDLKVRVTRRAFEGLCADLFESCLNTVESVVRDAGCSMSDITECVLVGGSTRVPKLQEKLYAQFGGRLELCKTVHPDEAVAVGAAVQGAILRAGLTGGGQDLAPEGCQDLVLLDVTPLSLGIELEGGHMSTLIKRSTAIPCSKTREYTTVEDYQTQIDVCVYEGGRPHVSGNNKLGEFSVEGLYRGKAGEAKVDVTFALDANGILSVSARDTVTNASSETTIKADRGRLDEDDIRRMIEDARKMREGDSQFAEKARLRNALEEACYAAKKTASSSKKAQLDDLLEWLEFDAEDAEMDALAERVATLKADFGVVVK